MKHYLGIDLGGTNIAVGLVNEDFRIVEKGSVATRAPRSAAELCDDMAALCKELAERAELELTDVSWAGIGSPGIVWEDTIYFASNLQLHNAPMAKLLTDRLGIPIYLQNDANAAAYGEFVAGAGRGYNSLVAMTIGTGIGGGIILDRKIWNGFNGGAAELGHTIIQPGGRPCACGNKGCLETYCSARGLVHSTKLSMVNNPSSMMWDLCEGDIRKVSGRTAFQGMRNGDAAGKQVVEEFLQYLAMGAANLINLIQPEVFCIGGGVSKEGDAIVVPVRKLVEEMSFAGKDNLRTEIVTAQLGNDAGIVGAAMLGELAQ